MTHHGAPALSTSHTASSHHSIIEQFINSVVRGFGWRIGSDAAHLIPAGLLVVIILAIVVYVGYRMLRSRS